MKAAVTLLLSAALLTGARTAAATDIPAARVGAVIGRIPDAWRYGFSLGGSYEFNVVPDEIGVRLGADVPLSGWLADPETGNVIGLRPELAFFSGPDRARLRFFAALRPAFGIVGFGGSDAHVVESLELGPEIEWRDVERSGLRARVSLFYAPAREPSGHFEWVGTALAFTLEYGKPTLQSVVVPEQCIDLPTRPCP